MVTLQGVEHHNLHSIDAEFPLERFTVVTGVSGSGKSSLVRDVLLRTTRNALGLINHQQPGSFSALDGLSGVKRAIEIDQSPIGRTPRSVPATYIGIWDLVRKLLAGTPEARARGYSPSRFSFNTEEGRCPECKGQGYIQVAMAFLPDVNISCETCKGLRFTPETLEIRWHGLNVGELLGLEVREAVNVFSPVEAIRKPLEILVALGLEYLHLGQPLQHLERGRSSADQTGFRACVRFEHWPTLYVMDEPTTGLHRDDVDRLIAVLQQLVDRGDSLVVIEHHSDVMLAADWLIDLGPEGGAGGGRIIAKGTPELVAKRKRSHTGKVLAVELAAAR